MTGGKENPLSLTVQLFDKAIYGIRDSKIAGLNAIGARSIDRLRTSELALVANTSDFDIPVMTSFDLIEFPGPRTYHKATVVVDPERIIQSKPEEIQGDLIRTLAIADQFPSNGFQRRYREVYSDALDTQKTWLESKDAPRLAFDPRFTGREELLKNLLGDARYYSDVGFEDWQNATEILREGNQSILDLSLLSQLKNNTENFMTTRQYLLPHLHQEAIQQGESEYLTEWTQERRTEFIAAALVASSLYTGIPNNLS